MRTHILTARIEILNPPLPAGTSLPSEAHLQVR